ncbi:anoctamin-4-like isoform X2 [Styela clava]
MSIDVGFSDNNNCTIELNLLNESQKEFCSKEPVYLRDGRRRVDYVLAYDNSEHEYDGYRAAFEKQLRDQGLELEYESTGDQTSSSEDKSEHVSFIKLHAPWEVLCKFAEMTRMPKPIAHNDLITNSSDMDWSAPFKSCWRKVAALPRPRKYGYKYSDHSNDEAFFTAPFDMARLEKFMIRDKETFFTTAERQRIVLNILNRSRYGDTELEVGINRLIDKGCYMSYFPLHEGDWRPEHLNKTNVRSGISLNKRQTLYWLWARPGMWHATQPLELIRQYFGEKIGMYFAWLGFYTLMLIPVAIIGILACIYGLVLIKSDITSIEICSSNRIMCPRCDDDGCPFWKLSDSCLYTKITRVFDNELTFFFAFIMSLWATFFLEFWKRKRANLVYKWDLENFEEEEEQIRPEYEGICKRKKVNPVTGKAEPYLPAYLRAPRLVGSCSAFFVLLTLVLGAVFGVVVYRIIVGAILPQQSSGVVKKNSSLITSISATCINFVIITLLNFVYEKIAEYLTNMEAPRTATDFEDSFTLKMFLFQAVNYYSSIVYIAFFKGKFNGTPYDYRRLLGYRSEECDPSGCLIELCIQLGIIMVLKQAFNNTKEIILPLVKNWWAKRSFFRKEEKDKVDLYKDLHESALYRDFLLEDPGRRYLFSEYLEMVIQFGFVTLFVASFPLAPLFALLNNVIEIRLDAYKFTTQIRRLPARRCENIGMWFPILKGLSTLAVITNGLVVALTSEFVPRLVYRFLYSPCIGVEDISNMYCMTGYVNATLMDIAVSEIDRGNHPPYNTSLPGIPDKCWFRASDPSLPTQPIVSFWHVFAGKITLLVVFEHAVFGLKLLIDLIIPDVPRDLSQQMERQKYLELKLLYDRDEEKLGSSGGSVKEKHPRKESPPDDNQPSASTMEMEEV